jgi:hypothetical protein
MSFLNRICVQIKPGTGGCGCRQALQALLYFVCGHSKAVCLRLGFLNFYDFNFGQYG